MVDTASHLSNRQNPREFRLAVSGGMHPAYDVTDARDASIRLKYEIRSTKYGTKEGLNAWRDVSGSEA